MEKELYIPLIVPESKVKMNKTAKIAFTVLSLTMIAGYGYLLFYDVSNIVFFILWTIYGISAMFSIYKQKSIVQILGDAYVKINENEIIYKPKIFKKETKISWKDIKAVLAKPGYLLVERKNDEAFKIPYNNLEYSEVQNLKETLSKLLKEKDIEYK